ncbi:MAG: hypothetical protein JRN11_03665 [Nitrososphaerota archaeon]|nr:hypothetical protein [Nitrososphaerota archaeon]MDG7013558.1 hypothetical protein [Nitrososphaerota archaeon]MDG7025828.1 hypothetical protein [Nitrososphaerota archaeon]
MPKRYLLLMAEGAVLEEEMKALAKVLGSEFGGVKVFGVDGNPRAVIVKGTVESAQWLREACERGAVGGRKMTPVLTSGAVGNLKRRARGAATSWPSS